MPSLLRRLRGQALIHRATTVTADAARTFQRAPVEIVIPIVVVPSQARQ